MSSEGELAVEWTPDRGSRRRMRFEVDDNGIRRIAEQWSGSGWRHVGEEYVTDLSVDGERAKPVVTYQI